MTVAALGATAWTREDLQDPAAVVRGLRARGVSLDAEEVVLLTDLLGRPPRWAEAVLFGILWSEHCSYKSTRHLLKRLPTRAPQVVIGPGEDAGVVALPAPCADTVLVLGHESHNHPSQVLPVEGAATGVGGIVRDIVCMGAEVVGVMDALRFGDPVGSVHTRDVMRGVVQGIAEYGNALGVPNLGGDVVFDSGFDADCLVNAIAIGLAPADGVLRSRVPQGPGPWHFVLVGKPTDESGFGGAAFASGELGQEDQRGAVQLPDPFLKRVLNVATYEAFRRIRSRGIAAGFKDLGAGGIACATSEMAAAGGRGARITLDEAHRVARELPPEVLLCSETQERYCWAVREDFAQELLTLYNEEFALGDVHPGAGARVIGVATDDRRYEVTWQGEGIVDCSVDALTTGRRIERRSRPRQRPKRGKVRRRRVDLRHALLQMLKGLHCGSREYLFRHYDTEVQGRTWLRPGEGDAAALRVHPERSLGVAFGVGGNPFWCAADPRLGAMHAVAEAARNCAVVGARPWALTDCLNFGHPEDAEVMGDLEATLEGLSLAAEALGALASPGHPLPFVSGNVSLYNQVGDRAIPPSPIVMCAGVVRDVATLLGQGLRRRGDALVLVGGDRDGLEGSAYEREVLRERRGGPPPLDLAQEARLQQLAVQVAEQRLASSAHDISDGGLLVALAEMMRGAPAGRGLGIDVHLEQSELEPAIMLFGERPAIVYATSFERLPRFSQTARDLGLFAWPIGTVSEQAALRVRLPSGDTLAWTAAELASAADTGLRRAWNEEGV